MLDVTAIIDSKPTPAAINPAHVTCVVADTAMRYVLRPRSHAHDRTVTDRRTVNVAKVCLTSGGYLNVVPTDDDGRAEGFDPFTLDPVSVVNQITNRLERNPCPTT